ncbi:MAG: tetraacyldisaccharide 4'-kinase, partial [Deltaproteobacteria bacterium]|nr:tetraacyldisaccharide 4'-kinase [Deltaproteobacteria bacterium]
MEIRKKIERVMTTCEKSRGAGLDTLLYLFSCIYAGAMNLRALIYRKGLFKSQTLLCTVISVGNLTVGGTGKTPLTIYVVDLLRGLGYNVAVLSRGYKGKMYKAGGIVSDGQKIYMD